MAADEVQQEPTMEEILASIRKIISEDDEPAPASAEAAEETAGEMEDVLELQPVEEEPEMEMDFETDEPEIDFDSEDIVAVDPEPEPEPEPEPVMEFEPEPEPVMPKVTADDIDDSLIEDAVAGSAATAFGKLMGTMTVSGETTLEALVRAMLKPLLKEWLNENLPGIVEAKVEEEVKRIARMAR